MYRSYALANYGHGYGMGQTPGTVVSSTTTLTPGAAPGPETWGNDPVATGLQTLGGSIVQAPYGQEEQFMGAAVQAIYNAGQVIPGNPDASMNACWTCAYVYAYFATQQLLATGSTLTNGVISQGTLGQTGGIALFTGQPGTTVKVSDLIHTMYAQLRADTYAMSYYGGCLANKQKGLNCTGGRLLKTGAVFQNQLVYGGRPAVVPPAGAAAAAAPAAGSNTGLILGGLAIAGAAAYLAFA